MLEHLDFLQLSIDSGNRIENAFSEKMKMPAPGSWESKSIELLNRIGKCIFHMALWTAACAPGEQPAIDLGNRIGKCIIHAAHLTAPRAPGEQPPIDFGNRIRLCSAECDCALELSASGSYIS